MNNIMHDVNGLAVPQRQEDGYVNATKLCKAAGKQFGDYKRLDSTKEYLEALSADMGIPVSAPNGLIQVKRGGNATGRTNQGTWVHPEVAVDLAQWLSPKFRIMVNRWIREWIGSQRQLITDFERLPEWHGARAEGQVSRRSVTDAIKDYYDRHPELSDNARKWAYSNFTNAVYRLVFGCDAKKFCEMRKVSRTDARDGMTEKELKHIDAIEELATRLIDEDDLPPIDAGKQSVQIMRLVGSHQLPQLQAAE